MCGSTDKEEKRENMKKNMKRTIAIVSAFALILGCSLTGIWQIVKAENSSNVKEWTIYEDSNGMILSKNAAGGFEVAKNDVNINLPEGMQKENLALYIKLKIADSDALASMKEAYVELAQETSDISEINWYLGKQDLKVGTNEIQLKLSEATNYPGTGASFSVEKTIRYFRVYSITNAGAGQATLYEVKLLDITEAGLVFGETDTYLQLSETLTKTPQTIEASIKKEAIENRWTIRPASNASFYYGLTASNAQTGEGDAPGAGVTYAEVNVPAYTSGDTGKFGFEQSFEVNIPSVYKTENLALSFWFYSSIGGKLPVGNIELTSSGGPDQEELAWDPNDKIDLKLGWNYVELKLNGTNTTTGEFDLSSVNYMRWYTDDAVSARITTDTTYRITDVKLIVQETKEEAVTEWTLRGADTTNFWYGLQPSMNAVDGTESGPEAGKNFAQVIVPAYDANLNESGMFGFAQNFTSIDLSAYSKDQLAVAFWLYSSTGDTLPAGQIELTSGGGPDAQELAWDPSVKINVTKGWNYVELKLNEFNTATGGDIDLSSVNYLRWYTDAGSKLTKQTTFAITDIEIVTTGNASAKWTIRSAEGTGFWYGLQPITSTVQSPEGGTSYAQVTVPAYDTNISESGKFGFAHSFNSLDFSDYEKKDLAISFWLYSSTGGKLPVGNLELTSSGQPDKEELAWDLNHNRQLHVGWNYIELKLSESNTTTGEIDLSDVNYLRWYTDDAVSAALRTETMFRITDVKVIALNPKPAQTGYRVSVTENVNTESLSYNEMIFSNTNIAGETTPYALFVTAKGHPALLWGTTQYTLNYDVCTGKWVDIAVVRDNDGYINFYINSEFVAKSESVASDILGKPVTAHCVGADGLGGQVFHGRIADVRVWEDARTEVEIKENLVQKEGNSSNGLHAGTEGLLGSWFLVGDIQFVLETMPDTSKYSNTAVFRGTRADDWIDYDKTQYDFLYDENGDENYWSIVFIPDIQNLTTGAYTEKWYAMADWIADNVETENIKHVIGAGDSTWNNLDWEYEFAKNGFDKFTDKVSWSNMVGNHDYVWGTTSRDSSMYQDYFGKVYIQSTEAGSTYVGCYADPDNLTTTENSYYRFSVNGVKWLILQLEYHPRLSVLEWAEDILEKHSEDNVILTTHEYIDGSGKYGQEHMDFINDTAEGDGQNYLGLDTSVMWGTYFQEHSNIKLILCGHSGNGTGAIVTRMETNSVGDEVQALMINAQDKDMDDGSDSAYYTNRALGMLSILRFSADGKRAAVQYYAPDDDKSFSPIDLNGNRNSNEITLAFDVETCSHTNTTILVNQNDAAAGKDGYTGDTYCKDCDTILKKGELIPATPKKEDVKEDTRETEKTSNPGTGDSWNPIAWSLLLIGSVFVALYVMKKNRKGER